MSPSPKFPPARGYKWADATPGNSLATKHGAHESVEKLNADPRAVEIAGDLLDRLPWLADPAFGDALTDMRLVRQRIERVVAWLEEHGEVDPDTGKPRHVCYYLNDLLRLARNLRADVGATPMAWAKIEQALSSATRDQVGIADHIERGRAIREAREARHSLQAASQGDGEQEAGR